MQKQIVVSGVQPSGMLHIGNYLGAIKQFVELQAKYKTFFFIADLHAITEQPEPEKLRKQTLDLAALYLACGLDPKKTVLFVQSHVSAHAELGWILSTMTPLGELFRMHQFKEKTKSKFKASGIVIEGMRETAAARVITLSESGEMSSPAGLLNYPILMAADILLYQADFVPVGEDQLQHLEFTRTIASKFNSRFGRTFTEPKALLSKEGARIMGLDDPAKKMSKSAPSPNNYIAMLDSPEEIRRKIKIAVTDSGKEIIFAPEKKPAISNLLTIYSLSTGKSLAELERKYRQKGYAEFKHDLAEVIIQKLSPLQDAYRQLVRSPKKLQNILAQGAKQAREVSEKTMREVRTKIGLLR